MMMMMMMMMMISGDIMTIEPPHDKTNKIMMCAQWRLRSAWASAQSDQSSCALNM